MEERCVRNKKQAAASNTRTCLFNSVDYPVSQMHPMARMIDLKKALQGPQGKCQQISIGNAKYL